ncbi:tryptophan 2,3-dioxygenase family protein [Allonocardiopsis opalescens]|uniref:Tryptophan 2,3-dioxygenase n=1 Tax=Allonocardiopsis opalescens TaxID=1144618 RepID=A0A2T0Q4A5_9ACTN|nr:tryptophan 2,3-dioxygenase family protein [Allonocardiopsis opalescens]PRX98541.1 tryptophan 2,3-dioxygenase [Allonocardiopsis opalescens]
MSAPSPSPTYGGYLELPELLELQHPLAAPAVHDELLFITVQQACELWFKQMLAELTDARDLMVDGDAYRARKRLERCVRVERVLTEQFDVLDTMEPQDFAGFRGALGKGNGGQSAQFWEITLLSGRKDRRFLDRPWYTEDERKRLQRRFNEHSLWDGFLAVLRRAGFPTQHRDQRFAAYHRIAARGAEHHALWELAEALVSHDQAWCLWQARHLMNVHRQIGAKQGTGGSSGASFLEAQQRARFYPELWDLRTGL